MNFFSTKFGFSRSLLKIKQNIYFLLLKKKRASPRQGVAQGRVPSSIQFFHCVIHLLPERLQKVLNSDGRYFDGNKTYFLFEKIVNSNKKSFKIKLHA